MAQRTIAAFFQSRPPPREALGDATNATAPVAFSDVSRKSNNDDVARTTTTPPPKRARVAAPLPFAKGADVMDVRGASSRALGAQFCNVDGREILLCGDAWGTEDLTRPISKRWREPDESSRLTVNENRAPTDVRASPSGSAATACDDAVTARVGDVVIRGTNGLVARADGAVIRVYDASNAGAPPVASLCLAHDSVSSDASTCECTRRATRLDARAVTRMTSHRLDAESDRSDTPETSETSEEESLLSSREPRGDDGGGRAGGARRAPRKTRNASSPRFSGALCSRKARSSTRSRIWTGPCPSTADSARSACGGRRKKTRPTRTDKEAEPSRGSPWRRPRRALCVSSRLRKQNPATRLTRTTRRAAPSRPWTAS
jgi:hypothetical protein